MEEAETRQEIVYIETSLVSYLTARPSRDIVVAAQQEVTREWWEHRRKSFDLIASELVRREASAGDPEAASVRLAVLEKITLVHVSDDALELAEALIAAGAVPEQAPNDALHIALATTNGASYLLTWNCAHIANAAHRAKIEDVCRARGLEPPYLCTPPELMEA